MPDREVQDRIAERVGALLEEEWAGAPHRFQAIPGARDVFATAREAGRDVVPDFSDPSSFLRHLEGFP